MGDPILTPSRIAVLLAVHREGGVVAAADALHLSASAVSQAIAKLEHETGLTMLDRTPTGAVVTPAGRILIELGEQIEADITDAKVRLRQVTGQVTGTITIGGFHTVIRSALIPFLDYIQTAAPGIEVHIREFVESSGFSALRSGKIDMLILERDAAANRPPSGFVDAPLFDEPWIIASPASMPQPSKFSDLETHVWLQADPVTASHRATQRILESLDNPRIAPHSYMDYNVALSLVAAGLGSAVLPQLAVAAEVPENVRLTQLPNMGARRLLLRYRQRDFDNERATRRVIQELRAFMGDIADELGAISDS